MLSYFTKADSKPKEWPVSLLLLVAGALLFFSLGTPVQVQSQNGPVSIDIRLDELITEAQVISLSTIGVDRRGSGQKIATLILKNETDQKQEKLYFHIKVSSTSKGVIAQLDQRQAEPFSLDPNQKVVANNNDLQHGLPGISTSPSFSGGLTDSGEELINEMKGKTRLPDDVFTLELNIYQGSNRLNGGNLVASSSASIGTTPITNIEDIYINAPGNELGSSSGTEIHTQYPKFDWDGPTGIEYRLVVAQDNDSDSPESLIESAKSTDPVINETGSSTGSTLLESEMVDALLSSSSYQYPSSGVRQLQDGKQYYWQVTALIKTADGQQEVTSEIWTFTLPEDQQRVTAQMSESMKETLRNILGDQHARLLQRDDVQLEAVVIDGQRFTGQSIIQRLNQFFERVQSGNVTISEEKNQN